MTVDSSYGLSETEIIQVLTELSSSLTVESSPMLKTTNFLAICPEGIPQWLVNMIVAVAVNRHQRFKTTRKMAADDYLIFTRLQVPLVLRAQFSQLHDHGDLKYWVDKEGKLEDTWHNQVASLFPELVDLPVSILLPVVGSQPVSDEELEDGVPDRWLPDVLYLLTKMRKRPFQRRLT